MISNIYEDNLTDNIELNDMGYLLALTGNSQINKLAIEKFGEQFGENGSFKVLCPDEARNEGDNWDENLLSRTDDFTSLTEIAANFPAVHELKLENSTQLKKLLRIMEADKNRSALFLKTPEDDFNLLSTINGESLNIGENHQLVYLGKAMDPEELAKINT